MKKLALTIAIIFGLGIGVYAQGGLFGYGAVSDEEYYGASRDNTNPLLPANHNFQNDVNSQTGEEVPLGSGIAVLVSLGGAYLLAKRRKE